MQLYSQKHGQFLTFIFFCFLISRTLFYAHMIHRTMMPAVLTPFLLLVRNGTGTKVRRHDATTEESVTIQIPDVTKRRSLQLALL